MIFAWFYFATHLGSDEYCCTNTVQWVFPTLEYIKLGVLEITTMFKAVQQMINTFLVATLRIDKVHK